MTDGERTLDVVVTETDGSAMVTIADLGRCLAELGLEFDEAATRMLAAELALGDGHYEMRLGEWQIKGTVNAVRALVHGTVVTSALVATGATAIPAVVLAVVVPSLFDLERISISPADRAVYVDLLDGAPGRLQVDDWYDSLSESVRNEITRLEFRDLVGRLHDAGLAEVDSFDVATLDPPSPRRRRRLDLP